MSICKKHFSRQTDVRAIDKLCDGSHRHVITVLQHGWISESSSAYFIVPCKSLYSSVEIDIPNLFGALFTSNPRFFLIPNHKPPDRLFFNQKFLVMPPPLSQLQRDIAVALLHERTPQKDIASAVNCSIPQVWKIARNLRRFGQANAPKAEIQGRPRSLPEEAVEVPFYGLFRKVFCPR